MPQKMENLLAHELKKKFDQGAPPKFDRIFLSKRPYQVANLKRQWHEIYGAPFNVPTSLVPPLQPEIDMILCKDNELTAVELKYFKRKGGGLNHSFYEGIEQTLALLRWGFDHAALWQLFEESITKEELWFYGGWTWAFLHDVPERGGLNLPIEFTFYLIRQSKGGYDFRPVQPMPENGGVRLVLTLPPYDPRFNIRYRHRNPLLRCPDVQRLRNMIVEWLETQRE